MKNLFAQEPFMEASKDGGSSASNPDRVIPYNAAIYEAISEEMERDETVLYTGAAIGLGNEEWPNRLLKTFGDQRIVNMPVNEALIAYSGAGMAMAGLRPVCEVQFADFAIMSFDAMINYASKVHFWTQGKLHCPMVLYSHMGVTGGQGNNHCQCIESWMANTIGMKIVIPTTQEDAKGLMKTAIRDNDPVIFLTPSWRKIYRKGYVPEGEYIIPFGQARVAREGSDLTLVCWHTAYHIAMEVAEQMEREEGISIEVIDPRTLIPFDTKTVVESVKKTGRLIVSHEAPFKFGASAEIVSHIVEQAYDYLKARPRRVCTGLLPIPTGPQEEDVIINKKQMMEEVRAIIKDGKR